MKKSGTFKKERPPFLKSGKKRGPLLCLCQVGSCSRRATPCKVATTSHATLARSLSAPRAGAPASYAFTEPMSKRQSKRKSRHAEPPSISKHGTPRLIRRQPSAVTILSRWCYRQIYSVKNILEVFFCAHSAIEVPLREKRERRNEREYKRKKRPRRATPTCTHKSKEFVEKSPFNSSSLVSHITLSCFSHHLVSTS